MKAILFNKYIAKDDNVNFKWIIKVTPFKLLSPKVEL